MKKYILMVLAVVVLVIGFASTAPATTYEYDSLNRLTKVIYDNGVTIIYEYDKAGNRIVKKVTK
ncbi:MAG: RHS repeat domain-containing protein [Planctomycetota bacterium]